MILRGFHGPVNLLGSIAEKSQRAESTRFITRNPGIAGAFFPDRSNRSLFAVPEEVASAAPAGQADRLHSRNQMWKVCFLPSSTRE